MYSTNDSVEIRKSKIELPRKDEFKKLFRSRIAELLRSMKEVADAVGLSYDQFKNIANQSRPTKKRDCIIAICATLYLDSERACQWLAAYGFPGLDNNCIDGGAIRFPRDYWIYKWLDDNHQWEDYQLDDKRKDYRAPIEGRMQKLDEYLMSQGCTPLDIIDRRRSHKDEGRQSNNRYVETSISVATSIDGIIFGEKTGSLGMEYSPGRYFSYATVHVIDTCDEANITITAFVTNFMTTFSLHREGSANQEVPPELSPYKERAREYAEQEFRRVCAILKDSRNYPKRISAKVIDNHLHVFTEVFDYDFPEFEQYILMDYCDGVFQFSVSKQCQFMKLYLDADEYELIWGEVEE